MSFAAFCACQALHIRADRDLLTRMQRKRIVRERKATYWRLWAVVAGGPAPWQVV